MKRRLRIGSVAAVLTFALLAGNSGGAPALAAPDLRVRCGSDATGEHDGDRSLLADRASYARNGLIAFVGADPGGQSQISTICPDGSEPTQLTHTAGGNFYPAWSRDGKKIAWTSGQSGAPEIWVMNADGSDQFELTFPPGSGNFVPSWSPAGDQIAFTSVRTGHPEIWVMETDGGDPQQLTTTATPAGSNAPNWSPDGRQIAFASDRSGHTQVYVMKRDGSGVRQLTVPSIPDFPDSNVPAWSPDGRRIAFWSGIEQGQGQVWLMDAHGGRRRQLTDCPPLSNCDNPAWSPDGTMILFETNRRGPIETWVMNADGGNQRPLLPSPYGAGRFAWQQVPAPGGSGTQQIVFMYPTDGGVRPPGPGTTFEIAVMNLDGSGFRQLTNDGKFKFLPHFSADATRIAYTRFAVGQYGSPDAVMDIAVYDLASGAETLLTREGHYANATWSPDGRRIAYLDTIQPSTIWTIAADGSDPRMVASASGAEDDLFWGDLAWSREGWLLFTVAQNPNGCFKTRTDKIRPDGSRRTKVSDGGPYCTPAGREQSGDADPGWSADGRTIYSSRGFPVPPVNGPLGSVERKIYAFSSNPWHPGKAEVDLSIPSELNCIEGVPKGSPDGKLLLVSRGCFDPGLVSGIYVTDTAGSYRTFITRGFAADWDPR